ncbi:MAG: putative transposase, partial [Acidobacteriota bacterium]|nr:putative transposase [Acidobacteriota bacterium]
MKMNQGYFIDWCDRLGLVEETRNEIIRIRNSEPARLTDSGPFNVSGAFNKSWKMGHSVQYESGSVEYAAALMYEDPFNDVIEYWDQPNTFTARYLDRSNKVRGHKCTPDFFLLRSNEAGWEEWKTVDWLIKRASEAPERYYKDEEGKWHYGPGEDYARNKGLYFRLRSSDEINYVLTRNARILHRFYKHDYVSVINESICGTVHSFLTGQPRATLSSLLELAQEKDFTAACIYELIAFKQIHVNINKDLLTEPETTRVFSTKEDAEFFNALGGSNANSDSPVRLGDVIPGTKLLFDGNSHEVVMVGKTLISLRDGGGNSFEVQASTFESYVERGLISGVSSRPRENLSDEAWEYQRQFSTDDRIVALERYEIILPKLRGGKVLNPSVSMRTVSNWVKNYQDAKKKYNNGLLGLLPLHKCKGSHEPRLPQCVRDLMLKCIEETYENEIEKNKSASYGEFRRRCKAAGVSEDQIPVYSTYRAAILARGGHEQEQKRKGAKASYNLEEFYWFLDVKIPPHGDHPWQICHVDHTELDILLLHWKTFKVQGRPYMTLLVDAYSRFVLGFYLSFDSPSKKAIMMVMRDCVRRHSHFPETLVVDKGPEFSSVYFDSLIARFNCDRKRRPTAKARFGSTIERLFGTTNTQFVHNLRGNTKPLKVPRQVTKAVDPKNWAVWNYGLLHKHLEEYFNGYNNREHPALDGLSPQEAYNAGMQQYGLPEEEIIYDRYFLFETMPETYRGRGRIVANRGIKFNYVFYNSPKLQQAKLIGTSPETRFDPYNAGILLAYVGRRWEEAYAPPSIYNILRNCSEKDIAYMTEELRQRRRRHAGGYLLRTEDVARYLATAAEDEERELQRRLD